MENEVPEKRWDKSCQVFSIQASLAMVERWIQWAATKPYPGLNRSAHTCVCPLFAKICAFSRQHWRRRASYVPAVSERFTWPTKVKLGSSSSSCPVPIFVNYCPEQNYLYHWPVNATADVVMDSSQCQSTHTQRSIHIMGIARSWVLSTIWEILDRCS